ncbi:MAG: hypothetical protein JSS43_18360 [Proteobacteria bacterium]|nr:hypothetical protein [Pseudomonadota bacterium]
MRAVGNPEAVTTASGTKPSVRQPTLLQVAIHASGHAVAHLVLTELLPYPAPFLRAVSVLPEGEALGRVPTQPRVWCWRPRAELEHAMTEEECETLRREATCDAVECAAGHAAEAYYRDGPMGSWIFCSAAYAARTASGDWDAREDMRYLRATVEWLKPDDTVTATQQTLRLAFALVATEWRGIFGVARILRDKKTMREDEFTSTWRQHRAPETWRRKVEARLGPDLARWRHTLLTGL